MSVPDFEAVIRLYDKAKMLTPWMINHLYGDQIYPEAFHYVCFTFQNLRALLDEAGFSQVNRMKFLPYSETDCSSNIDTLEFLPTSINLEAVK